jgi:hypothetical protein
MTLVAEVRDLVPITDGRCLDERYPIIESEGARATGRTTFRSPARRGSTIVCYEIVCTDIRLSGRPERAT